MLLTRLAGTTDIRSIGSGNIGATNVLRTGRKGLAAATLLGDALKGTLAVLVAAHFGRDLALRGRARRLPRASLPGLARFKGGKGVATYIGMLSRARLAGGARLLPDLARGRGAHPLFLARGPGRERGDARRALAAAGGRRKRCSFVAAHGCCFGFGIATTSRACSTGTEGKIGASSKGSPA